ncbi:MAG: hypothetical protein FD175_748 [Beijerinckiaceae bacterium]|nr:MAG: hypothetical protein FD175_748 [Beijerinckiaceae bacterium]
MRGFHKALLGLAVAATFLAAPLNAREQIPAENREYGYSAELSACDSPGVLARIQSRFSAVERRFWNSDAEIVTIEQVRQAAFRPHGLDLIPRRYCQAVAVMSTNRKLKLRYAIIEGAGIVGMGEGIQYCLDGYDRNHTAMPGCNRLDR